MISGGTSLRSAQMLLQHIPWIALFLSLSCLVLAESSTSDLTQPAPEMQELAHAFVGDWNNVELMEPSGQFPRGAGRRGASRCELGVGGTSLICRGSSDGSAGKLDHLIVIWWDKNTRLYEFFICFKDQGSGCEVRGTAHWDGDNFVNDYSET